MRHLGYVREREKRSLRFLQDTSISADCYTGRTVDCACRHVGFRSKTSHWRFRCSSYGRPRRQLERVRLDMKHCLLDIEERDLQIPHFDGQDGEAYSLSVQPAVYTIPAVFHQQGEVLEKSMKNEDMTDPQEHNKPRPLNSCDQLDSMTEHHHRSRRKECSYSASRSSAEVSDLWPSSTWSLHKLELGGWLEEEIRSE